MSFSTLTVTVGHGSFCLEVTGEYETASRGSRFCPPSDSAFEIQQAIVVEDENDSVKEGTDLWPLLAEEARKAVQVLAHELADEQHAAECASNDEMYHRERAWDREFA